MIIALHIRQRIHRTQKVGTFLEQISDPSRVVGGIIMNKNTCIYSFTVTQVGFI